MIRRSRRHIFPSDDVLRFFAASKVYPMSGTFVFCFFFFGQRVSDRESEMLIHRGMAGEDENAKYFPKTAGREKSF